MHHFDTALRVLKKGTLDNGFNRWEEGVDCKLHGLSQVLVLILVSLENLEESSETRNDIGIVF